MGTFAPAAYKADPPMVESAAEIAAKKDARFRNAITDSHPKNVHALAASSRSAPNAASTRFELNYGFMPATHGRSNLESRYINMKTFRAVFLDEYVTKCKVIPPFFAA
jgi:hypothetical protein